MAQCPTCGSPDEDDRFCTRCGQPLAAEPGDRAESATARPTRRRIWLTVGVVAVAIAAVTATVATVRTTGASAGPEQAPTAPPVSASPTVDPAEPTAPSSTPSVVASVSASGPSTEAPVVSPAPDITPMVSEQVASDAPTIAQQPGTEQIQVAAVDSAGNAAEGFTVVDVPDSGIFACDYPSEVSVAPGIHDCAPTAASANVCWGTPDRVTLLCAFDPWDKQLRRMRADQPYPDVPAADSPLPWGLELSDGSRCLIRNGGSWPGRPDGLNGAYSCDAETDFVLVDESGPAVDGSNPRWTVRVGSLDGVSVDQPPPTTMTVTRAYFADVAPAPAADTPQGVVDPEPYRLRGWSDGAAMIATTNSDLYFTTPSGNISCTMSDESSGYGAVICRIKQREFGDTPRPASCPESMSWVPSFVMLGASGGTQGICTGDSPVPPVSNVLPYGSTLIRGDYRCSSAETGVTCTGPGGHGFALSRASFSAT